MALQLFLKLCSFTRNHKGKLLGVSSIGLFAANISYHVFPEQTFRKLYQEWNQQKGEPAELSDRIHTLFQDALTETHCNSTAGYTPFAAYGFQPVSAGIPWLPAGCLVGVPANYNSNAEDGDGIVNRLLVINGEEIDWSSEVGKKFRDSLMLSADAQKFSLAREAAYFGSSGPVIQASVAPVCFAAVCISSVGIKQLLGLYAGPMLLRGIFNLLAIIVGFTGYCLCSDSVSHWLDYRFDRKVASVSKSYAQGGVEFYEKILARNRLLRGIMGKKGAALYAPSGNLFPKHKIRLIHAPYTCRRDRLQHMLDTMKS